MRSLSENLQTAMFPLMNVLLRLYLHLARSALNSDGHRWHQCKGYVVSIGQLTSAHKPPQATNWL